MANTNTWRKHSFWFLIKLFKWLSMHDDYWVWEWFEGNYVEDFMVQVLMSGYCCSSCEDATTPCSNDDEFVFNVFYFLWLLPVTLFRVDLSMNEGLIKSSPSWLGNIESRRLVATIKVIQTKSGLHRAISMLTIYHQSMKIHQNSIEIAQWSIRDQSWCVVGLVYHLI